MDIARQLVFPLVPLKPPILASALNNKVFAYITHKTEPMQLITSSNQWETTLFMFPSPDTALILSFPWLEKHNPHLEWTTGKVLNWSLMCHSLCLHSALPSVSSSSKPSSMMWRDFSQILFVCLYDILIFSNSLSEHKVDVHCVLQQLLENCLYVKAENVNFMTPQSLSWVLWFQGDRWRRTQQYWIRAVAEWPVQETWKQLRFLGFANFYRR